MSIAELAILAVFAVVYSYFSVRSTWVNNTRLRLLYTNEEAYRALPSHGYMLLCRPFCWDIQKFVKGEGDANTN